MSGWNDTIFDYTYINANTLTHKKTDGNWTQEKIKFPKYIYKNEKSSHSVSFFLIKWVRAGLQLI